MLVSVAVRRTVRLEGQRHRQGGIGLLQHVDAVRRLGRWPVHRPRTRWLRSRSPLTRSPSTSSAAAAQRGAPRLFEADVTYRPTPQSEGAAATIEVNEPLARRRGEGLPRRPRVRAALRRSGTPPARPSSTTPWSSFRRTATSPRPVSIKVPDATPPLGLDGLFLPTSALNPVQGPHSTFPGTGRSLRLPLGVQGRLGLDSGVPQSVYQLDTTRMQQIGLESLRPGQIWTLPDGSGTVDVHRLPAVGLVPDRVDPGKELRPRWRHAGDRRPDAVALRASATCLGQGPERSRWRYPRAGRGTRQVRGGGRIGRRGRHRGPPERRGGRADGSAHHERTSP